MDEIILNKNNTPVNKGDPDYEAPHNFLVTLCHQNKNLMNSCFDYMNLSNSPRLMENSEILRNWSEVCVANLKESVMNPSDSSKYVTDRKTKMDTPVDMSELLPIEEVYEKYSLNGSFNSKRKNSKQKEKKVSRMVVKLQPRLKPKIVPNHLSIDRSSVLDMTDKYEQSQAIKYKEATPIRNLEK